MVASSSQDGTTKLWEATSDAVKSVAKGVLVDFTDDGRTLILGSSDGLTKWDLTAGTAKLEWPMSAFGVPDHRPEYMPALLPTQPQIAFSTKHTVEVWDLDGMTQLADLRIEKGEITNVALSDGAERLVAGTTQGHLRVWDLGSLEKIADLAQGENGIEMVTISADAEYVSASAGGRVVVWNLAEERPEFDFKAPGFIGSLEFSPDGGLLATSELQANQVTLHRVPSGELVDTLRGHVQGVGGASFSPDGKTLVTGSHDRRVKLWNVATGQEVATIEVGAMVFAVRFSPDGRTLAASYTTEDGFSTRVWRAPAWEDGEGW